MGRSLVYKQSNNRATWTKHIFGDIIQTCTLVWCTTCTRCDDVVGLAARCCFLDLIYSDCSATHALFLVFSLFNLFSYFFEPCEWLCVYCFSLSFQECNNSLCILFISENEHSNAEPSIRRNNVISHTSIVSMNFASINLTRIYHPNAQVAALFCKQLACSLARFLFIGMIRFWEIDINWFTESDSKIFHDESAYYWEWIWFRFAISRRNDRTD